METRTTMPNAKPRGSAIEQISADEVALLLEAHEGHEEAFEAVIVRLDGAAAELLFRTAGT
jgi:hypothetical protein